MLSLTDTEVAALKWVENDKVNPRAGNIFEHAGAMKSIRERGLVKRVRHPGWTGNALTVAGRDALAKQYTLREQ